MLVELGFTARHQNLAIYGGLNLQDGGAINSFFGGHLGVRYTFGGRAPPAPAPVVAPAKTCADLDDDGDGVNNCDDKCPGSRPARPSVRTVARCRPRSRSRSWSRSPSAADQATATGRREPPG